MNGTITLRNKLRGSVSMSNTIINGGASPYPKHVGPAPICSFSDGAQDAPLKSLKFNIEPSQDLHGYDSPWPAGGGKNIFDKTIFIATSAVGVEQKTDTFVLKVLTAGTYKSVSGYIPFTGHDGERVYLKGTVTNSGSNNGYFSVRFYNDSAEISTASTRVELYSTRTTHQGTVPAGTTRIAIVAYATGNASASVNDTTTFANVILSLADVTYSPYSNICPISGWSQVDGVAAGKNLWEFNSSYSQSGSGTVISNQVLDTPLRAGTYRLTVEGTISNALAVAFRRSDSTNIATATLSSSTKSVTVTLTETAVKLNAYANAAIDISNIQLELGSTATTYAAPTLTPITISLGQTVYGGNVDALAGKCYARPYYASYSGQALVGPWISSHDKYVAGGTPTTGAQVVDMGGAKTTLSLTPVSVNSLLGQNNIWCNTGDTELDYYPAAASLVAVQNRTNKVYVSIPLGKIRYDTYQATPNQALDLDSFRAETGVLMRTVLSHTATKVEFSTVPMTDDEWQNVWAILSAGFNNSRERKLKLRYYDSMSSSYKTGWFYVPDVQFGTRNVDEANGIINYNEIRLAFIEY